MYQKTDKEVTKVNLSKFKKIIQEPITLLPKVTTVFEMPTKFPIEPINSSNYKASECLQNSS